MSYANSLLTDPWGKVLANAGTEEKVLICDIDFDQINKAREQIPIMKEYLG